MRWPSAPASSGTSRTGSPNGRRETRTRNSELSTQKAQNMCGIIGYIGDKDVVPVLIDGLRRLEYRGYDSAGVAVVKDGHVDLRRSAGKLANLETVIGSAPLAGDYGVGHTGWAMRGRPN